MRPLGSFLLFLDEVEETTDAIADDVVLTPNATANGILLLPLLSPWETNVGDDDRIMATLRH